MLIIWPHSTFFRASCCAALGPTFPPDQSCNHSRITLAIGAIKCHPREKGTTGRSERQHPTHGDNAYNLSPTCQPFLGDGGQFLLIRNNWIQTNIEVFDERHIRVTFHIWEIRRDVSRSLCLWTGTLRGTREGPCVEQVWGWEGGLPRVWGRRESTSPHMRRLCQTIHETTKMRSQHSKLQQQKQPKLILKKEDRRMYSFDILQYQFLLRIRIRKGTKSNTKGWCPAHYTRGASCKRLKS